VGWWVCGLLQYCSCGLVYVCGTDSTGNIGLLTVQIFTAFLVKFGVSVWK
jgi:hypothetical protein